MWQNNSKLTDIISYLPKFVTKYYDDCKNKILNYFGEYKINNIYYMNDFLLNQLNVFFKVDIEVQFKAQKKYDAIYEKRYLVITDIYVLIFEPCGKDNKHNGRLVFISDLRDFTGHKLIALFEKKEKNKDKIGVVLQWNKSNKFNHTIVLDCNENIDLVEILLNKQKAILENFTFFHEDFLNNGNNNKYAQSKLKNLNFENLEQLIEHKENLYYTNNTQEIFKDLMILYQNIIELYSASSNEKYKIYMEKLHNLLENSKLKDVQDIVDNEKTNLLI